MAANVFLSTVCLIVLCCLSISVQGNGKRKKENGNSGSGENHGNPFNRILTRLDAFEQLITERLDSIQTEECAICPRLDSIEASNAAIDGTVNQLVSTVNGIVTVTDATSSTVNTIAEKTQYIGDKLESLDTISSSLDSLNEKADTTHAKLDALQAAVDALSTEPKDVTVLRGRLTTRGDGNSRTASCPDGTVMISCKCAWEDNTCDGSRIEPPDNYCYVFDRRVDRIGDGQQAIAVCVPGESSNYLIQRDPPGNPWGSGGKRDPEATCPSGYEIIDCVLIYRENMQLFVQAKMDSTSNSCKSTQPCSLGNGCFIAGICKKLG